MFAILGSCSTFVTAYYWKLYNSLHTCLIDLEKNGHLIRISEEVDPHLEMAAIHLRVFQAGGPALCFERVKGSQFQAASNLFGTIERSRFIFRDTIHEIEHLIALVQDPAKALKHPLTTAKLGLLGAHGLPWRQSRHNFMEVRISDLPRIKCWPKDGGAFVTLPQVYTEDPDYPGIMKSNLGMYRIQISGNQYEKDKEIGLHYQLHRGIGVHQTKWNARNLPMKVSIFIGGPPAHSFAAVMPLPEGVPEVTFAGVLGNRRFRYTIDENGYVLSTDADFVITGEVYPGQLKPEGPFGDHLGYYSLEHLFPLMRVKKVYAKRAGIWPFTVVGRPPQEDTQFGALIHEMTGSAIQKEIPGVKAVNAVDAAGVHPLLLAIGSERYTPYSELQQPQEILTQACHILGSGQLSLAKYLFITAGTNGAAPDCNQISTYFLYFLERVEWTRDVHFITNTTVDTLDYSGERLNGGSKVFFAAYGSQKRVLRDKIPATESRLIQCVKVVLPGVIAVQTVPFSDYRKVSEEAMNLTMELERIGITVNDFPLVVWCDDAGFVAGSLNNFLWVTFTRSNPSHDVHGVGENTIHKHWGCTGPLIIDARMKPHHAPELIVDPEIEKRVDALGAKGGSLNGVI